MALKFDKVVQEDFMDYLELHTNPNVMSAIPIPVWDEERCRIEFNSLIRQYNTSQTTRFFWAVRREGDFVGLGALFDRGQKGLEVGYRIKEKYWSNGYGTQICEWLIDVAFKELKANRVFADVEENNIASKKIISKFMTHFGSSYNVEYQCQDLHFEVFKNLV